jgi:hypothetical protein
MLDCLLQLTSGILYLGAITNILYGMVEWGGVGWGGGDSKSILEHGPMEEG